MCMEFRWIMFGDCVELKNIIVPKNNTYIKKHKIYKVDLDNDIVILVNKWFEIDGQVNIIGYLGESPIWHFPN